MATAKKTKAETEVAIVEQGEQIVKKKGRGGTQNFPTTIEGTKKEDVQRIGKNLLKWYGLPPVKTDEEVDERLLMFFEECIKSGEIMTVEKMCLALGYSRKTVWEWETGHLHSGRRADSIKKAKEFLASFDAEMVTEGKINPVTYIFRAKNYFGMKDQQEYVLTPNNPLGEEKDPEEIRKRLSAGLAADY